MKVEVKVGERCFVVELDRSSGTLHARIDGREVAVDAAFYSPRELGLLIAGAHYDAEVLPSHGGDSAEVFLGGSAVRAEFGARGSNGVGSRPRRDASGLVTAPMPGKVVALLVEEGDAVLVGQGVVVVEAMKMENEIQPAFAGHVKKIHVQPGQVVESGALLLEIG